VTENGLNNMLKQADALNSLDAYTVAFICKPMDISLVTTCLTNRGFNNITYLYWHKTGHQTPTPVRKYTSSVEIVVIGFRNLHHCYVNLDSNPVHRHNHVEIRAVTTRLKDQFGQDCNMTQKPWELSRMLATNHCSPGHSVLVIGAGAGGDVFGAASAGREVYAVEKDVRQFEILAKEMSRLAEAQKASNLKHFGKEDISSQINSHLPAGVMPHITEKKNIVCVECGDVSGQDGDNIIRTPCFVCGPPKHYCGKEACSFVIDGVKYCPDHAQEMMAQSQDVMVPSTPSQPAEEEDPTQDLDAFSSTSASF
jgi:N6-adenosine-specific RNA methylase IME4